MKRLSLALVIAAASGLIAAGCGGDDEDEGGDATTGSGEISVVAPTDVSVPEDSEELQEKADEQLDQIYEDCIASLEQIPENAREEAREGCEALKE